MSEFLIESEENLDRVEQELLALEKDPTQLDRITVIFRAIHTIKGTCGFLELRTLETVTHAGENLLVGLRDGLYPLTPEISSDLLRLVDAVRAMLRQLAAESGSDGTDAYAELVDALNRAVQAPSTVRHASMPAVRHGTSMPVRAGMSMPAVRHASMPAVRARQSINPGSHIIVSAAPPSPALPRPFEVEARVQEPPPSAPSSRRGAQNAAPHSSHRGNTTIRVDVAVLEEMMTLVGELVLSRNQLLELTQDQTRTPLAATCQRLDQITTELQGCVMKTRMQPIGAVWNKLPRVVRELAVHCGKRVIVDLEGSEIELDKTVLEAISEPLTHILRNAVDHGIEHPNQRASLRKPVEGRIRMRAGHKGGCVVIEITDDGAGINVERVKRKAIEKGLISATAAASMSESDVYNLLFAPGFSTAEQVTNISGRGVGMDVVKTKIERIGGSIEIRSVPDVGTSFWIRLPLTLAIVPAIVVAGAGQRFAIPQLVVQELLRITDADQVEYVENAPVLRLRGKLLPLVWLGAALGVQRDGVSSTGHHVVVLNMADGRVGLVVDEILNSEEIVVKPLSALVSNLDCYAGCTILGDGRVALILEVANVIARARLDVSAGARARANAPALPVVRQKTRGLVVFQVDADRYALPLTQVERLEKLSVESIESCAGHAVLQYRGQTIRVVRFSDGAEDYAVVRSLADSEGMLHAIICPSEGRTIALLVDQLLDVVEYDASGDAASPQATREIVALGRVTTLRELPVQRVHGGPLASNDAQTAYERDVA